MCPLGMTIKPRKAEELYPKVARAWISVIIQAQHLSAFAFFWTFQESISRKHVPAKYPAAASTDIFVRWEFVRDKSESFLSAYTFPYLSKALIRESEEAAWQAASHTTSMLRIVNPHMSQHIGNTKFQRACTHTHMYVCIPTLPPATLELASACPPPCHVFILPNQILVFRS